MTDANPPAAAVDEFLQPAPSDPIIAHGNALDLAEQRIAVLEAEASEHRMMIGRILRHLDPTGNSRTLFPVDRDGEKL